MTVKNLGRKKVVGRAALPAIWMRGASPRHLFSVSMAGNPPTNGEQGRPPY
jgi:hypothetical protein